MTLYQNSPALVQVFAHPIAGLILIGLGFCWLGVCAAENFLAHKQ